MAVGSHHAGHLTEVAILNFKIGRWWCRIRTSGKLVLDLWNDWKLHHIFVAHQIQQRIHWGGNQPKAGYYCQPLS